MVSDSKPADALMRNCVVGPTEEVVQAFIENLVEPLLLKLRVSANNPPTPEGQRLIATQMHAVVVLYNYYYRKQKLDLKFLDLVSFCNLALKFRPALSSCMKIMNRKDPMELIDCEDQYSVTEKAIKEACDFAVFLDPAEDIPIVEGCPISKVAVLLIDSEKKNCFLQYSAITEGVWSVIEKDVTDVSPQILATEKAGSKRKRDNKDTSNEDQALLKLAYDAVKDVTGIESSDIVVLETHITHSLTKEKSAVKFYMMQCSSSFDESNAVQLSSLVESLQGPLAEKFLNSWNATSVVEYFLILPYAIFISSWLWGKDLSLLSTNSHRCHEIAKQSNDNLKKSKQSSGGNIANSVNTPQSTGKHANVIDEYNEKPSVLDLFQNDTSKSVSSSVYSRRMSEKLAKYDIVKVKSYAKADSGGFVKKEANIVKVGKLNDEIDNHDKDVKKTLANENVAEKIEKKRQEFPESAAIKSRVQSEKSDNDASENLKAPSSSKPLNETQSRMIVYTDTCLESENTNEKTSSEPSVGLRKRNDISSEEHGTHGNEVALKSKVETADHLKFIDSASNGKKVTDECADLTITGSQNRIPATNNQLVQFDAPKYNVERQNPRASEELHDALALLNRRRQEVYSQMYSMEDTLTMYEDYIERIREGGDFGLARNCIISIVSGKSLLVPENDIQSQNSTLCSGEEHRNSELGKKHMRSSTPFLLGKSSCEDLEYICLRNDWRLPRYFVEPSDGKFQSKVIVVTKDLQLSSQGGLALKPCEARELAAAQMIANLRSTYS